MPRSLAVPLLALSILQAQPPEPAMAQGLDPGPSVLAVPMRINLGPAFDTLEKAVPVKPPKAETWLPLPSPPGAVYRFNLYREALTRRLRGNQIHVRTMAHYWLEVGLKAGPVVKAVGSCGLGTEGFRRVLIGARAEVGLTPQWDLQLRVAPDDPEPLSPCEVTFLGYDITDRVVAGMKASLLSATSAMEQQVRASAPVRQKLEALWAQAQQPIQLAEGIWLAFNPERIRMGPWSSEGKVLTLTPELQARPVLTLGPAPAAGQRPLPPLETTPLAPAPSFRVHLDADLSFEHATAQLRRQMAGRRFDTDKGSFEVVDASVHGNGGKAILELSLKGRVEGRLTLQGRPTFDEKAGTLRLVELDYTLESRSWITSFGEWLFRTSLRRTLQEQANWLMDKSLKNVKELAQAGLNRPLASGIALKGSLSELTFGQPRVLSDRFRVDALMQGAAEVEVDARALLGVPVS